MVTPQVNQANAQLSFTYKMIYSPSSIPSSGNGTDSEEEDDGLRRKYNLVIGLVLGFFALVLAFFII